MAKKKAPTAHERILLLNKELEERLDSRLSKVDERLDALTQSLELLAMMQMATERQIDRFVEFAKAIIDRHDKRITKLEGRR